MSVETTAPRHLDVESLNLLKQRSEECPYLQLWLDNNETEKEITGLIIEDSHLTRSDVQAKANSIIYTDEHGEKIVALENLPDTERIVLKRIIEDTYGVKTSDLIHLTNEEIESLVSSGLAAIALGKLGCAECVLTDAEIDCPVRSILETVGYKPRLAESLPQSVQKRKTESEIRNLLVTEMKAETLKDKNFQLGVLKGSKSILPNRIKKIIEKSSSREEPIDDTESRELSQALELMEYSIGSVNEKELDKIRILAEQLRARVTEVEKGRLLDFSTTDLHAEDVIDLTSTGNEDRGRTFRIVNLTARDKNNDYKEGPDFEYAGEKIGNNLHLIQKNLDGGNQQLDTFGKYKMFRDGKGRQWKPFKVVNIKVHREIVFATSDEDITYVFLIKRTEHDKGVHDATHYALEELTE